MRTKLATALTIVVFMLSLNVQAENENRKVPSFSEISLRVSANLHLKQGDKQSVEVNAKSSTLDELITEVKGRELVIRFAAKNYIWKDFNPGKIDIYVTVPEIDKLALSGSGNIQNDGPIKSRILDLAVSGSGNINLDNLTSDRVKVMISGSGNVSLNGSNQAEDLSVNISGSGAYKGIDFKADDVNVRIAGSGNADVYTDENLEVRIAGSGDVTYKGNPNINQSTVGSGKVKSY
ncbi:MAG TPA: head GIN domain-containing protein [Sunxiuqinia sp.]|nr:head GIN domain-containing protein [Sunxiuqinia sp.]